jgi:hypothetical protein
VDISQTHLFIFVWLLTKAPESYLHMIWRDRTRGREISYDQPHPQVRNILEEWRPNRSPKSIAIKVVDWLQVPDESFCGSVSGLPSEASVIRATSCIAASRLDNQKHHIIELSGWCKECETAAGDIHQLKHIVQIVMQLD